MDRAAATRRSRWLAAGSAAPSGVVEAGPAALARRRRSDRGVLLLRQRPGASPAVPRRSAAGRDVGNRPRPTRAAELSGFSGPAEARAVRGGRGDSERTA